jgi:hypothetical protein
MKIRDSVAPTPKEDDPGLYSGEWPTQPGTRRGVDELAERLVRLCRAVDLGSAAGVAERVFRELIAPRTHLAEFIAGQRVGWLSEISDDNTPIEFSVTLAEAGAEVRVLFEPQGDVNTLASHRQAALDMHEELERDYGAHLARLRRIEDLFLPEHMQGPFALWSAVVFSAHRPPAFKAYCNPQAQGVGRSAALVQEALQRLGIRHAWPRLTRALLRRGPHYDELKYLALDLSDDARARVKVYVRHHDATPADMEIAAGASANYAPGETLSFARALSDDVERFQARATFSCAAYEEGDDETPAATTEYLPVCAYANNDAEVERRISAHLIELGLDPAPYRRMLAAFSSRPLELGVGLQSWAALRRYQGALRLTVYLATELHRVFPPGSVPAATIDHSRFASFEQVLDHVATHALREHPVFGLAHVDEPTLDEWSQQMVDDLRAQDADEPTMASAGALAAGELALAQLRREYRASGNAQRALPAKGRARNGAVSADDIRAFAGGALAVHALFWKVLDDVFADDGATAPAA